ncbi:MAG: methyltransferase [Xenococcaceae cyanobacterium MO_188.B29]|nr:methyltransferase [Xenococcaceae cyanobacterium MO_188.B29]
METVNDQLKNIFQIEHSIASQYIAQLLQLEAGSKILDLGGGTGGLLVEILRLNSSVSGILFDLSTLKQQA